MTDSHQSGVIGFFDTHPINEEEILAKLAARGANMDALTEEDLKDFDQDHYGGLAAVDALAAAARIGPGAQVADFCAGLGGPARYLAHRYGADVTGIELTIDGGVSLK